MRTARHLSTMFDSITKIDTDTREILRWEGPHGHTPGEAIFVPRPATVGEEVLCEDDGISCLVLFSTGLTGRVTCCAWTQGV